MLLDVFLSGASAMNDIAIKKWIDIGIEGLLTSIGHPDFAMAINQVGGSTLMVESVGNLGKTFFARGAEKRFEHSLKLVKNLTDLQGNFLTKGRYGDFQDVTNTAAKIAKGLKEETKYVLKEAGEEYSAGADEAVDLEGSDGSSESEDEENVEEEHSNEETEHTNEEVEHANGYDENLADGDSDYDYFDGMSY